MTNHRECPSNQEEDMEVNIKHLEKRVMHAEVDRGQALQSHRLELDYFK